MIRSRSTSPRKRYNNETPPKKRSKINSKKLDIQEITPEEQQYFDELNEYLASFNQKYTPEEKEYIIRKYTPEEKEYYSKY